MGNGVASKLRKSSRTMAGRLSRPFDFPRAVNSRRLELFEPNVKCGVEFVSFSSASVTGRDSLRQACLAVAMKIKN